MIRNYHAKKNCFEKSAEVLVPKLEKSNWFLSVGDTAITYGAWCF